MQVYILCFIFLTTAVWGTPVPVPQSDIASHIVIVTPQAQVHLEPAIKYDTPAFIHHLSPLARIATPHEETIVYVPSNAGASIIPVENVNFGRANSNEQPQKVETKQWDQIAQQIQQAIQTGSAQLGPQLSEAAAAASSAAAAAGQGLFPSLFPSSGSASAGSTPSSSTGNEDKSKITYELPANTEVLLPSNARIFAFPPAIPHVVDFVHSPVFVGPIPAIRARSIQDSNIKTSEIKKPEQLLLQDSSKDFNEAKQATEIKQEGIEKKTDFDRQFGKNSLRNDEKKLLAESEQKFEKLPESQYVNANNKLSETTKETFNQADADNFQVGPNFDSRQEGKKENLNKYNARLQPQSEAA